MVLVMVRVWLADNRLDVANRQVRTSLSVRRLFVPQIVLWFPVSLLVPLCVAKSLLEGSSVARRIVKL